MSLQSWLQNSWLVQHTTSPEEIKNLLAISDADSHSKSAASGCMYFTMVMLIMLRNLAKHDVIPYTHQHCVIACVNIRRFSQAGDHRARLRPFGAWLE
jgi:hypothetical protein